MVESVVANAHLSETSEGHTAAWALSLPSGKKHPDRLHSTRPQSKSKQKIERLGPESSQSSFIITSFIEGWSLKKGLLGRPVDFNRAERKRTVELTETIVAYYQAYKHTQEQEKLLDCCQINSFWEHTEDTSVPFYPLQFPYSRMQPSNLMHKEHLSWIYLKNQAIWRL